jgi:hypothetical protein
LIRQRGGALGTLVVLVALAVIGYFVYQQFLGSGASAPPSCKAALNGCISECRRTTSEAADNQACQTRCQAQFDACQNR